MHEQDLAIVRGLVPVAWADGDFADKEREMLAALLEAYSATEAESREVLTYAEQKRSLDDIDLASLSMDDRRVLLQHAVLLSFVDGTQAEEERAFLVSLAERLRIQAAEAAEIMRVGEDRARAMLHLL